MKGLSLLLCSVFIALCSSQARGQAAISASPPRLYFRLQPGGTAVQRVIVSNPGDKPLQVSVSIGDWDYDSLGNNQLHDAGSLKISCAKWLQVLPGSFFTVPPKETQYLTVNLTVPRDADTSTPVHTAVIYFTQLNPLGYAKATNGAVLRETVRMATKVYLSFSTENSRDVEITNFQDHTRLDTNKKETRYLQLNFDNAGKIWLEGKIQWELLDLSTGEKIKMAPQEFFSLPGDHRTILQDLPAGLKKGKYSVSAIINYGNKDELKIAELDFQY